MRKKSTLILLLNPMYYRRHILLDRFTTSDLLDLQGAYNIARPVTSNFHNNYRKTYYHSDCHHGSIPSSLLLFLSLSFLIIFSFADANIFIIVFHIPIPFSSSSTFIILL